MLKNKKAIPLLILLGLVIFVFRTLMGLSRFYYPDKIQIYLIGLQSFTTGLFPYFGPDVVYTETQIPGALQGLLISMPLKLWSIPESPYLLLNILSFSVLIFLAWYLSKRFNTIPKWFTFSWVLTCPWVLYYSCHIENPSYVIVGAVLFFIGVFELSKFYPYRIINKDLLFFFTGFAVFWIMQIHLSWVLTIPYLIWIVWMNRRDVKILLRGSVFFLLGAAVSISTLIPTLLEFSSGGVESNMVFNPQNLLRAPVTILRFLSLASYEMGRFLGTTTQDRVDFVINQPWTAPLVLILLLTGFAQVGYFIFSFFRNNDSSEWIYVKWFVAISSLILSFSFLFSVIDPRAHQFYMLFPLIMWYSFYCYQNLFKLKFLRILAPIVIVSGILFQISLFIHRYPDHSLFVHRTTVVKAIEEKDYTLLDVRRESKLMRQHKHIVWHEMEEDGKIIRYTEFESQHPYFRSQNLVNNRAHSGNFSCKIDSIQPYGISFSEQLSRLGNPEMVNVKFFMKSDQPNDFILAYETKTGDLKTWHSAPLKSQASSTDWEEVSIAINLSDLEYSDASIKFYFTMPDKSGSRLYVDDLSYTFY